MNLLKKLRINLGLVAHVWRTGGYIAVLRAIYNRVTKKNVSVPLDIISHYNFITQSQFGPELPTDISSKTINWVIPNFGIGSGGHLNIFRLVYFLEKMGFENRFIIVGYCSFDSPDAIKECINKNFVSLKADVFLSPDYMPPAWITVATSWITAYYVRSFAGTRYKCYFVQDFEPFFSPPGSEYLFAENTYRFGFYGITAGTWLANKLQEEYKMECDSIGFSVEHDRYFPRTISNSKPGSPLVFFYARPPTARRAFELGMLVLNSVARNYPDSHFIFAGWDVGYYDIPFSHSNLGMASLDDLPDIYSQCDVALVISCTNISLLPLEIMACGCPVVSNRGPHVEWLLNSDVAALADPTVEDLSRALSSVINDKEYRTRLVKNGLAFCKQSNWKIESNKLASIFTQMR